jgi:hypothetical protein
MFKYISHRGNLNGPEKHLENTVPYIDIALKKGFDVEIDIWLVDNQLYLGHDKPENVINIEYLSNDNLWCHCKNIEAFELLLSHKIHCFYHTTEDVILTSRGYVWTYPNKLLINNSICVLPEIVSVSQNLFKCSGICSDYVEKYKNLH